MGSGSVIDSTNDDASFAKANRKQLLIDTGTAIEAASITGSGQTSWCTTTLGNGQKEKGQPEQKVKDNDQKGKGQSEQKVKDNDQKEKGQSVQKVKGDDQKGKDQPDQKGKDNDQKAKEDNSAKTKSKGKA